MIESLAETDIMPERFTETLRAASEPGWSHAVGHRFVKELFAGAVPDAVMARYLIQDHRFLDSFLTLLGAALASPTPHTAPRLLGGSSCRVRALPRHHPLRRAEQGVPRPPRPSPNR